MKENLLVLNRNIESEDIDSVALAIKKISTSSENQFNELKKERWFNRLFNMITFSNKKNMRLAEQISTLAQAQEILIRILLLLSEKSSEISELVKNNTKDIEKLGENNIYLLNRIKKLEDKVLGIKRKIKPEDLSLQAKEILSACLNKISTLFDYTNDNQKLYVNFILNLLNAGRIEYDNLEFAINELDSNNEKTQILISCLEYIYLKNNNFNILKTNYQILNFIEIFYFSEKKIDEIKNQVERDSNFDGIIFRYTNNYKEDFEDDNFLLDFINDIGKIEIEKEDLYINSMINIKEGEIYVIENKNIHISSMINCSGTLEIRNCTLYYNETENSPNRINLEGNYTLKIEDSTIICENYSQTFFIVASCKEKGNVYLIKNSFIECLNFIGETIYDPLMGYPNNVSTLVIENCKFENCIGHFLDIRFDKELEINNCSIIQNNLPKYHENKGLNHNIRKLFSICTEKSESKSIFSNNNIYISKYIKDDKYRKQYSTLISYVDKIENSVFDFEEAFEISTLIFIGAKEIKNCKFYRLSNIGAFSLIDNCYFWACKLISPKKYSDNYYTMNIQNCEFECCYDTLFDEKLTRGKYENIHPYYTRTLIFKNCKFSGIKIDNYIFENELIKLGPKSEIKKCEFINLHPKAFLIDVAITEASAKIKKVLIEKCIFKDCSSKTRDKNSIIVKSNWGFRIFRKDYTYTVTEVKDCQFV